MKKQRFRQSQAGLHTWTGLLVGWILYLIFLNGTVSYWREEITRWSRPEIAATKDLETVARGAISHLSVTAPKAASWTITLPDERASGATATWKAKGKPAFRRGTDPNAVIIGPDGKPVTVRDTEGGNAFYRLHFDLRYIPVLWGRWVVGFCTMFMLVAIISGVITHKKIFTDFFTFRPGKGQRSWLDAHNALAVLSLPFHAMITYTGLITLMVLYMPFGATANYPTLKAYYAATALPKPPKASGEAAPLVDIGQVLRVADQAWDGGKPTVIRIDNPGDKAAQITAYRRPSETLVDGRHELVLDGVTGQIRSTAEPSSSGMIARGGMVGLHAARFSPMTLRWFFFLSGVAGTAMVATGLVMWTSKRRAKLEGRRHFGFWLVERLNIGTVAGLPLAMTGFLWANRLLPLNLPNRGDWEVHVMALTWLVMLLHAFVRPPRKAWIEQPGLTGLALVLLPVFDQAATARGLIDSLKAGDGALVGMELGLLSLGAAFLFIAWRVAKPRAPRKAERVRAPQLAEARG
ncbi:PepSY-associated TM helix domain-containing protein [Caulobacter sp.]|uniref:PepSY domain-containing protein n=1 Tax=Caulobacter sp. TaxID=78 RepID=UPI00161CFEB9